MNYRLNMIHIVIHSGNKTHIICINIYRYIKSLLMSYHELIDEFMASVIVQKVIAQVVLSLC